MLILWNSQLPSKALIWEGLVDYCSLGGNEELKLNFNTSNKVLNN